MMPIRERLTNGEFDHTLKYLYASGYEAQKVKYAALTDAFEGAFGASEGAMLFSAPGRSEIGGNHTDHQLGRVLAATVTVDTRAVVAPRNDNIVRIHSQGYTPLCVSLDQLAPNVAEENASEALVRGIAERFTQTKRNLSPVLGLEGYRTIMERCRNAGIALPVVAIGGITAADVENILATGVTGIALSGALLQAENTLEETQRIINIINRTKQ